MGGPATGEPELPSDGVGAKSIGERDGVSTEAETTGSCVVSAWRAVSSVTALALLRGYVEDDVSALGGRGATA